jgi:hypothetical protein
MGDATSDGFSYSEFCKKPGRHLRIRDLAASRWIANGEKVRLLGPPEPAS